jgi:3alpha(or 20beta)-hydroxysteroid dehydrogenase
VEVELQGKAALVTGAARGIGAVIARRLAEAGATVAVTDVLDAEGEAKARDIGCGSFFVHLDVTEKKHWDRATSDLVDRAGKIDVLVNNAAILYMGSLLKTPGDTFRRVLDVNTLGPFLGIQTVAPIMIKGDGGSIVNISSVDGLVPLNALSAYVASKFALQGLAKTAALELGRAGVRVNCVCPTGGNSAMHEPWLGSIADSRGELEMYGNSRAIARSSTMDEVADAVLFLSSDRSQFITGVDLPVDGGHTAGNYLDAFAGL